MKNIIYAIISVALLSVAVLVTRTNRDNIVLVTMVEGLYIGGWVFMWEAISTLFIKHNKLKADLSHNRRLLESDIEFRYS